MSKSKGKQKQPKRLPAARQSDQFLLTRVGRQKLKEDDGEKAGRILDRVFEMASGKDSGHALHALKFVNEWCGPKTATGLKQKAQAASAIAPPQPEREQTEEELKAEVAELDEEIKELQSSIGSIPAGTS